MQKRSVAAFILLTMLGSTAAAQPWRFVAVGDSRGTDNGVNTTILAEIAAEIVSQNAQFIVFPGDLITGDPSEAVENVQFAQWKTTMQPVYNAGIGVYAVRGNHDDNHLAAWNNAFTGAYAMPQNGPAGEVNLTYSVTHQNAFIVGLDFYVTSNQVNQTWLDAQLAANAQPHVFTFAHEPAFQVHHTSCMDDNVVARDAFWASIGNAGSRAFFVGHDHFYDHALVDNNDANPNNDIHQLVVGSAGAPLRDWTPPYTGLNSGMTVTQQYHAKQYGYVVVEIDDLDVTLTWMERTGPGTYAATEQWGYIVPEPASFALLALGGVGVLARRRRTFRKSR